MSQVAEEKRVGWNGTSAMANRRSRARKANRFAVCRGYCGVSALEYSWALKV